MGILYIFVNETDIKQAAPQIMKKLLTTFKCFSIGFGIISTFFILFSLSTSLRYDNSVDFKHSIDNIYKAIDTYSELYKFTFVICAFWATLRQLEISQSNYETTLQQIKFVQDDIIDKRNKDIKDNTLKECNFYLSELQVSIKDLFETGIVSGMPVKWELLSLTTASLEKQYPATYEIISKLERPKKNIILITLYQLEAFSSLFIYGNLDKQLGKDIIGYTYSEQAGFLLGFISYFRESTTTVFGQNTIKLYNEWRTDTK